MYILARDPTTLMSRRYHGSLYVLNKPVAIKYSPRSDLIDLTWCQIGRTITMVLSGLKKTPGE